MSSLRVTTQKQRSTDRRPWWGAGLCVAILAIAGCSGGESKAVSQTATSAAARPTPATTAALVPTTAAPTMAPVATPAPTAAPAPAPDPAATLNGALDALTTSYHFVSTVTLDGTVALVADGDRIGDGSRLTLTSSDGNVSYVITPDGSWVMPDGGDWQALDSEPANADPIGALRTPAAVQVATNDGTTAHLAVTVAPATLGIAGDAPVHLDVAITGNVLSAVTYATTVDGKAATVTATFGPPQDPNPIAPPA